MTKTYMDFYNDPSIANEPRPLREVHAARMLIAHENEGLSSAQWVEKTNAKAVAIAIKYGLKMDHTKWRQDLFKDMSVDDFLKKANEYDKMAEAANP